MSEKPTLLIDMDGCLVDMLPAWLVALGRPGHPVKSWDVHAAVGLPAETVYGALRNFPVEWWAGLPHMPGAPIIWTRLSEVYHCVVCTSPAGPESEEGKHLWVLKHLGMRAAQEMVFSKEKHLVPGDVIIDDKPSTLLACREVGKITVRFSHPYNRDVPADVTVSGWADAGRQLIKRMPRFGVQA